MLGKIKTYAKLHPVLAALVGIMILYLILKLFGLPDILIDLDVIILFVFMAVGGYTGWLCAEKYPEELRELGNKIYKKLKLDKLFGELESSDALWSMLNKIERRRKISEVIHKGVIGNPTWIDTMYMYIGNALGDAEEISKQFDSFDLAAMMVYSMTYDIDDKRLYPVIYEAIKDMLIHPFTCKINRRMEEEYYVVYEMTDVEAMDSLDENVINEDMFKKEVINLMKLYATNPLTDRRREALAENLRHNSESMYAF